MTTPPDSHSSFERTGIAPRIAMYRTAGHFAKASVLLFVFAGIGASLGNDGGKVMMIIGCVFALTMLMIAGMICFFAMRWQKHVDAMFAGDRLVHWRYKPVEWFEYIESEKNKNRWLWALLGGILLVMGFVFSALMNDDGHHIADMPVLTWTVPPLLGFFVGAGGGWLIQALINRGHERMKHAPGEVLIGANGVYLGGTYWPWRSVGQSLVSIRIEKQPRVHIVAKLLVYAGNSTTHKDVVIPVPVGFESEAIEVVAQLSGENDEDESDSDGDD